jgi:CheY-like chemotaxis protein
LLSRHGFHPSRASAIRDIEKETGGHVPILGVTANVRDAQQEEMIDAGIIHISHAPKMYKNSQSCHGPGVPFLRKQVIDLFNKLRTHELVEKINHLLSKEGNTRAMAGL